MAEYESTLSEGRPLTRRLQRGLRRHIRPMARFLAYFYYNTPFVDGSSGTVHLGRRVGLANTLCNVSSGSIFIGDDCAFGYNVMLLTGRHQFDHGTRASLAKGRSEAGGWGGGNVEVPSHGYDIHIGSGTWLASGVVVTGGVRVGRNAIVAANSVVTRDIPDFGIAAGAPARVIGDTRDKSPWGESQNTVTE